MANRQWFLTKLVGAFLGLFLFVSSCIGAANLVGSLRRDIDRSFDDIDKNYSAIMSVCGKVDEQEKAITSLRLQDRENITKLVSLADTLSRVEAKLDKLIDARSFPQ